MRSRTTRAGVADHDRPLAARGVREAALAGDWLRAHAPAVDAVLCSTATRTRETLARTRIEAPVNYVDRLYDATPGTVIDEINGVDRAMCETLLVIGHEPAMSSGGARPCHSDGSNETAAEQSRRSSRPRRSRCCAPRSRGTSWRSSSAALVTFHVPR